MQALTANYSTRAEIQRDQYLITTVGAPQTDRFRSPSLFILTDNRFQQEFRLNNRIFSLCEEFAELENNWDGDGALRPSSEALKNINYVANVLESTGYPIHNAAPGPNGEIMIDLRNKLGTRSVELIFYPSRMVVVFFHESQEPFQEIFQFDNLPNVLEWLNKY